MLAHLKRLPVIANVSRRNGPRGRKVTSRVYERVPNADGLHNISHRLVVTDVDRVDRHLCLCGQGGDGLGRLPQRWLSAAQ